MTANADIARYLVALIVTIGLAVFLWSRLGYRLNRNGRLAFAACVLFAAAALVLTALSRMPLVPVAFVPFLVLIGLAYGHGRASRKVADPTVSLWHDWDRLTGLLKAGAPNVPDMDRIQRLAEDLEAWRNEETAEFIDAAKEIVRRWLWSEPTTPQEEMELDEQLLRASRRLWANRSD